MKPLNSVTMGRQSAGFSIYIHFAIALSSLIVVPLAAFISLDTQLSAKLVGYLVSGKAICALFTSYLVKERRVYDLSLMTALLLILSTVTYLFTLTKSFNLMLTYQCLSGLCCGAISVLNFNDVMARSQVSERKERIGNLLSCYPLALAIGVSPLVFIASESSWRVSLQLLSVLIFIGFLGVFLQQRQSVPAQDEAIGSSVRKSVLQVRHLGSFALCSLAIFFSVFSTFLFSVQLPTFMLGKLHIAPYLVSIGYVVGGLGCFATIQRYTVNSQAFLPLQKILLASLGVATLATLVLFSQNVYVVVASFILFIMISASRTLVVKTDILHYADSELRTLMVGTQGGVQYIAMASAGVLGSLILSSGSDELNYSLLVEVGLTFSLCVPALCILIRRQLAYSK